MEIWRAADDERYTGQWSCWSADRESAEAYQDNPGFGGAHLLRAEVRGNCALDLTGSAGQAFQALAAALAELLPEDEWRGEGLYAQFGDVYQAWESNSRIADALASRYYWLIYDDDYPARCTTWCFIRPDATLVAEEVA